MEKVLVPKALNRFPKDVVVATRLTEFKVCLVNALRQMMGLLGYPVQGQGLDTMDSFQVRIFHESMIWEFGLHLKG